MSQANDIQKLLESEQFDLRVNKTREAISIYSMTTDFSRFGSAEISNIDFAREDYVRDYGIDIVGELWYFNRIKVKKEGTGLGTALMKKLTEILDVEKITLWDDLNPYGGMSLQQLIEFNKKFGFVSLKHGSMIRYP